MNGTRMLGISILVLAVVFSVAACQQTDAGAEPTATATLLVETQPAPTATEATEVQPTETLAALETPAQVVVVMRNIAFNPQEITVAPGTAVVWRNEDGFAHTVTSGTRDNPTDLFDSGNVAGRGGTFEFTFEEPGTLPYFCKIHPGMNGTVIVR